MRYSHAPGRNGRERPDRMQVAAGAEHMPRSDTDALVYVIFPGRVPFRAPAADGGALRGVGTDGVRGKRVVVEFRKDPPPAHER